MGASTSSHGTRGSCDLPPRQRHQDPVVRVRRGAGVSWLKAEGDLGALSTLQLQILVSFCSISRFPSTRQADLPWHARDRRSQGLLDVIAERAFRVQPGLPGGCGSCGRRALARGKATPAENRWLPLASLCSRLGVSIDTIVSPNLASHIACMHCSHSSILGVRARVEHVAPLLDLQPQLHRRSAHAAP